MSGAGDFPRLWRAMEEAGEGGTARPDALFAEAFPDWRGSFPEASRRAVLKAMGACLTMGALAGCGEAPREAVPYIRAPERAVPGRPRFYASAVPLGPYVQPVIGECHEGRPTRLDGNPDHPLACGTALDPFGQASVLQLYDPDRSQTVTYRSEIATWDQFRAAMASLSAEIAATGGAGTRLLCETSASPTLLRQADALRARFPGLRWHVFDPLEDESPAASILAFGRPLDAHYRLDRAAVVVAMDCDPFAPGPRQVRHGALWGARRRAGQAGGAMSRLFLAESTPGLASSHAERRLAISPGRAANLLVGLAAALHAAGTWPDPTLSEQERAWVHAAAGALRAAPGQAVVLVGSHQPAAVQAFGHWLNAAIGASGRTVLYTEAVAPVPEAAAGLQALVSDMEAGRVRNLMILGANPAYHAPADLAFAQALRRVGLSIHAGLYADETAALCTWHVPLAHPLETWSDGRAVDGTATVMQPMVNPLFGGRSAHELIQLLAGAPAPDARQIVQDTWRAALPAAFEASWRDVLVRGFVPDSAPAMVSPTLRQVAPPPLAQPRRDDAVDIVFRPDPTLWDGRFANVGWLQELPKPLTKLVWDTAIFVGPALAAARGWTPGDPVAVECGGRELSGPVWVLPGQDVNTVMLTLGHGRSRAGSIGNGIGSNAFSVRTAAAPWMAEGRIRRIAGERYEFATTQHHDDMAGRDYVRVVPAAARGRPSTETAAAARSLYPDWPDHSPAWGMVVDLDLCIGCNACVQACQAENNVPVVGREQVMAGREMHWLRVDRYYSGPPEAPDTYFLPVPCMHCEQAPCEVGCPVNATVHSTDGLNEMVYNRCIGTRTCSAFCPYKVRRFNFFDYAARESAAHAPQRNPDVTVRMRGVMEKCTYCVQRISAARRDAEKEERPIRDGEVVTACQTACPTQAIVFGDISRPDTAISRAKADPRGYSLLEDLNTRPRTTYRARIRTGGEEA